MKVQDAAARHSFQSQRRCWGQAFSGTGLPSSEADSPILTLFAPKTPRPDGASFVISLRLLQSMRDSKTVFTQGAVAGVKSFLPRSRSGRRAGFRRRDSNSSHLISKCSISSRAWEGLELRLASARLHCPKTISLLVFQTLEMVFWLTICSKVGIFALRTSTHHCWIKWLDIVHSELRTLPMTAAEPLNSKRWWNSISSRSLEQI